MDGYPIFSLQLIRHHVFKKCINKTYYQLNFIVIASKIEHFSIRYYVNTYMLSTQKVYV